MRRHVPRLVIPPHAADQCRERLGPTNLRALLEPALPRLAERMPLKRRVAWMDAPGKLLPVFERTSPGRPLVLVTVLTKAQGLSNDTQAIWLNLPHHHTQS